MILNKAALMGALALLGSFAQDTQQVPPGAHCIGYELPEAEQWEKGYTDGGSVTINTPLTAAEKRVLSSARQETERALKREDSVEQAIIHAHHLTEFKDCHERLMIRYGDDYISDFMPRNPNFTSGADKEICKAALKRKRAVAIEPTYGGGGK